MPKRAFQGRNVEDLIGLAPGPRRDPTRVFPRSNLEANVELGQNIVQQKDERQQRELEEAKLELSQNLPAILDGSAPQLEKLLLEAIAESGGFEQAIRFTAGLQKYRDDRALREAELFKIGGELGLKNRQIEIQRDPLGGIKRAKNVGFSDILPTESPESDAPSLRAQKRTGQVRPEGFEEGDIARTTFVNRPAEMTLQDFVRQGGAPDLPSTPEELDRAIRNIEKQSRFFLRNFFSNFPGAKIDLNGNVTVKEGQNQKHAQSVFNLISNQIPEFGQKILLRNAQIINRKEPGKKKDIEDSLDDLIFRFEEGQSRAIESGTLQNEELALLDQMGFGNIARTLAQPEPDEDDIFISALEQLYPGPNARG